MGLDEIKEGLRDRRLYKVADEIKISYMTLNKLVSGKSKNFELKTLEKITNYLDKGK